MNVTGIKKTAKRIGIEFIFVLSITAICILGFYQCTGKGRDSEINNAVRTELDTQRAENSNLRKEIGSLRWELSERNRRIELLEVIERRFSNANKRLEELRNSYGDNNSRFRNDINELGIILQSDRDSTARIREILQGEDS